MDARAACSDVQQGIECGLRRRNRKVYKGIDMAQGRETCIVLAGGRGTRVARLSAGGNKHLLPLLGKPALIHVLEPILASPCIASLAVVTGRPDLEAMEQALASIDTRAAIPAFAQETPDGTLRAVEASWDSIQGETFAVHYGDNIFAWHELPAPPGPFPEEAAAVLYCLRQRPPDLPRYGVVSYENDGDIHWVRKFQEKPALMPEEPFLLMSGFFRFQTAAFQAAAPLVQKSQRDEWELPSIIPALQAQGHRVMVEILDVPWIDYGTEASFAIAETVIGARSAS